MIFLFFCTANHVLIEAKEEDDVILILAQKNKNGENIKMILNLKKNNKIIRDDCIFIEILQYEIPKNLTLSFLELEETNLSNPI